MRGSTLCTHTAEVMPCGRLIKLLLFMWEVLLMSGYIGMPNLNKLLWEWPMSYDENVHLILSCFKYSPPPPNNEAAGKSYIYTGNINVHAQLPHITMVASHLRRPGCISTSGDGYVSNNGWNTCDFHSKVTKCASNMSSPKHFCVVRVK